jgi:TRAP-type C4-dicarboxylate transport system permease large subunit
MARQAFVGFRVIGRTFLDCFFAVMTPVVILGGMFSGFFTPTEAAAVACLYALFLGFVVYRTLKFEQLGPILMDTAVTTSIVMVLMMAAAAGASASRACRRR